MAAKPLDLYIYPLTNQAVFPYQMVHMRMYDDQYDTKEFNSLAGIVTKLEGDLNRDHPYASKVERIDHYSRFGTLVKITSEEMGFVRGILNKEEKLKSFRVLSGLAFARFRIISFQKKTPYLLAQVEIINESISKEMEKELSPAVAALKKEISTYYECVLRSDEVDGKKARLEQERNLNKLLYNFITVFETMLPDKLYFMQLNSHAVKIQFLMKAVKAKTEQLKVTKEIEDKVRQDMFRETSARASAAKQSHAPRTLEGKYKESLEKKRLPDFVREAVEAELAKTSGERDGPDKAVSNKYVQTLLSIPWSESTQDNDSLENAKIILDRDHSGLAKVKSRILQYLSVKFLKGNAKGTIICLHGPPGVGKTSIAKSIADALGRSFSRISLGGLHDEAEIRGHRRTYVGALPGLVIQTLIKCKSNNPVILLDEIDKLTRSMRGDPSSALLQVLDPNQNSTFTDHYVALPCDLSNVFFIATANQTDVIQAPLLDRMQLIEITGYSQLEKQEIAEKFLIPKQIRENGLSSALIEFDSKVAGTLIRKYTFEAGVRQLEQKIANLCRNVARKYLESKQTNAEFGRVIVSEQSVEEVLGPEMRGQSDLSSRLGRPGVAVGMAWTSHGGRLLLVETSKSFGKGRIEFTGSLGDVMKESIKTVLAFIKSKHLVEGEINGLKADFFERTDIHIHFPSAATPKDGPSAGITIACALVSLLLGVRVKSTIAMTGEVSLLGFVLPVGGIKEKVLAAFEEGMKEVMLPRKNGKDLEGLPQEVRGAMKVHLVDHMDEAFKLALQGMDQQFPSNL